MTDDKLNSKITEMADTVNRSFDEWNDCAEPVTVQSSMDHIGQSVRRLADAISPFVGVAGGTDATGGHVECLTESVMGVTAGLVKIAEAISDLADAVRDHIVIDRE